MTMKKIFTFGLLFVILGGILALVGCGETGSGGDSGGGGGKVAVLSCAEGINEYQVEGTPIQFCYDPAWGEPVFHDAGASKGSNNFINFPNTAKGPEIWYQSVDYELDVPTFCFDCLNLYAPEESLREEIKTQLSENFNFTDENLNVRKSDISGQRAARVHVKYTAKMGGSAEDKVTYYVPNAWEGYHMSVTADIEMAARLDDFVYDMVL